MRLVSEGASKQDAAGFCPKQLFGVSKSHRKRQDADWVFHTLLSYAEFPPLVPPIMAKEWHGKRKPQGGFMVASDKNNDIVAPLLRPDLNDADMTIFEHIATSLGHDPRLRDRKSYMQFMNYNQISYMELLPMAPSLREKW